MPPAIKGHHRTWKGAPDRFPLFMVKLQVQVDQFSTRKGNAWHYMVNLCKLFSRNIHANKSIWSSKTVEAFSGWFAKLVQKRKVIDSKSSKKFAKV